MKKTLCRLLPAFLLLAFPAASLAAETSLDATTLLRFQQDAQPGFHKKTLVPLTQFLGVDVDKLGDGNLSLHLLGWGRVDLADRSVDNSDDAVDGSLTYGYLQYRFGYANAQARAGRLFVHEGIVNEQLDGASARTDLPLGFALSAFGGATVRTDDIPGQGTDGKGGGIAGGRLSYRYGGLLELGFSGVYESKAPTLSDPALAGRFGDHRLIGGDIWIAPHRMVQLSGHTSYNTESEAVAEHSYLLQVTPVKELVLAGEFNDYHDRDLFYSSILFASLIKNLNQQSRVVGGSASYAITSKVELSGDYKHYSRDIGKAERFGGELRYNPTELGMRTGFGYHYLRSSPEFAVIPSATASGSFHEIRAFAMHDTKNYFAALDVIAYLFKKEIANRDSAWEALASLGYHMTPNLALSGDLSYGQNPRYDDEVKGLLRLTYNMTTAGKGGTK